MRPLKMFLKVGFYSCNSKKNENLKSCVYFQILDGPPVGGQNNANLQISYFFYHSRVGTWH